MLPSIFMRLSKAKNLKGELLNGEAIMQKYRSICEQKGSVWYSTDVLSHGMAKKRRKQFIEAIEKGISVKIFFAISEKGNGTNEIEYEAEVLDIETAPFRISSPDKALTPDDWANDANKLWIKVKELKQSQEFMDDFIIISTGKSLSKTLKKTQCSIYYISKN